MCQWTRSSLVQVMACHLFSSKLSPKTIMIYYQTTNKNLWNFKGISNIGWFWCSSSIIQMLWIMSIIGPWETGCHFKTAIFNLVLLIGIFTLSNDNALRWMPSELTDDKSTWVQVMAWCRQATIHYLSQCWPSSMSPYGITRPQWIDMASATTA